MFKQSRCYDSGMNSMGNNFMFDNNMAVEFPEATGMNFDGGLSMPTCPIYECPQERVCHREVVHEVPHVCPINTKIINHHIFRHTYTPCYTCSEENVCSNVYEGSCCNF